MGRVTLDLQGYTVVLSKVIFITRVFEAEGGEGHQFNLRLDGDVRLSLKFPTRHEAELERSRLVAALQSR